MVYVQKISANLHYKYGSLVGNTYNIPFLFPAIPELNIIVNTIRSCSFTASDVTYINGAIYPITIDEYLIFDANIECDKDGNLTATNIKVTALDCSVGAMLRITAPV